MGVLAGNPKVYDLVASSVQLERIATGFGFTEGPVWHPDGYLLFSDMPMDVRRRWTEADGIVEVVEPAQKCNGMTLDADLNLYVCEHASSQVIRATLGPDGTETSRETIDTVRGVAEKAGRVVSMVKDTPGTYGFILNRVFAAAYREAQKIVDDGIATPEDVDKAMITGRNWPAGFFGSRGGIGKQW